METFWKQFNPKDAQKLAKQRSALMASAEEQSGPDEEAPSETGCAAANNGEAHSKVKGGGTCLLLRWQHSVKGNAAAAHDIHGGVAHRDGHQFDLEAVSPARPPGRPVATGGGLFMGGRLQGAKV
jgi:hypothetical protein